MFRVVSLCAYASAGFWVTTGNVVRRVTVDSYDAESEAQHDRISDVSQENEAAGRLGGMHCVVWGDWQFEGKKFHTRLEAEQHFTKVKRTELAAVQYHGTRQMNRYLSKRLKEAPWARMKKWCNNHKTEMSVHENGAPLSHTSADRVSSLFEASSAEMRSSRYNPVIYSLAAASSSVATALDTKTSTLSGKISLLEKEMESSATKASSLLKRIGVEGADSKEDSLLQSDHHLHHADSHSKLKSRLASLEEFTAIVQKKTNLLETELFGAAVEQPRRDTGHSFKVKIEALATQADEVKSRLLALESTPIIAEAAKLEEQAASVGSKSARIFTSMGIENVTAPAMPTGHQSMKTKLGSLEGYVGSVQRNAATLEYEILGNSWNLDTSGTSQKAGSVKDHVGSLAEQLRDLESRVSSLASAPIVDDVRKMENAVTALASRATALSKNVGLSGSTPQDGQALAPQGSSLKAHIGALEQYVANMQSATVALEEELAGNVGVAPAQSQKDTLKSKAKFLELQVENMNARISALERQV